MNIRAKNLSVISVIAYSMFLTACTCTPKSIDEELKLEQKAVQQSFEEILSIRARPETLSELKYECRCMDEKISGINDYANRMSQSKYGFIYQSLGREKVSVINSYKVALNCQQLEK